MRIVLLACLYASVAIAQRTNGSVGTDTASAFAREMVAAHNRVRAKVGVPPLAWSEELARSAQKWADTLIESGGFYTRGDHRFGENLFEVDGRAGTPEEAVNTWGG